MTDDAPDLGLPTRLMRQMMAEQDIMRDDMRVMTANVIRLDNTLMTLLT